MTTMHGMYDEIMLQRRMATLRLNFRRVALKAKIDPKTAKQFITTGKGHPDTVGKVAKALRFKVEEIVKDPAKKASQTRKSA